MDQDSRLVLASAWLRLASYGCVCNLGSLPLMHGSDLTPLLMAEASPPRSRLGLAPPRLVWLSGMLGSPPLMHGSCLTPSPPPWLGSVSYGCVCMLGSLPVMHGSGLTLPSPWLGPASPRMALHACWTLDLCTWLRDRLSSHGCACMLGSPPAPLMHGAGLMPSLSPSLSPWLGSASPRMAAHACWARCL